jgi:hypothetical protein
MPAPALYLGAYRPLDASPGGALLLPAHHLVTHGVVVGMTGSGKTGLLTVLIEETLRAKIPVLAIDVKGDLANLLLAFPGFSPSHLVPWVGSAQQPNDDRPIEAIAAELAAERERSLTAWSINEADMRAYTEGIAARVITPGSPTGELLHVFSSLERRSERWDNDLESARSALNAAVSLVLRLLGRPRSRPRALGSPQQVLQPRRTA